MRHFTANLLLCLCVSTVLSADAAVIILFTTEYALRKNTTAGIAKST